MFINDIFNNNSFKLLTPNVDLNKKIEGIYCCDLLSWVMSHAKAGDAWITVQTHINIVAVASLIEMSCIIIPEKIEVESETIEKAIEENIPIIQTHLNSYEIFLELHDLGLR